MPRPAAPIVQFALDVRTVDEALAAAEMGLRAGVDWLEAGTPLILFSGIPAVEAIATRFADRSIVADIKIVDGARKYVVAAARHGATIVSVCGVATDATIREAIAGARETGVSVCVDLYAAADPVARAREAVAMGADLVYLHYGGDPWTADPAGDGTLALVPRLRQVVDVPIGFCTASADSAVGAVEAGADIIAIGYPFLTGPDAEANLTKLVGRVRAAGEA
jgi:3-hexulose-6-phosphate synthase/6-phospho-3-hexuloisomerase